MTHLANIVGAYGLGLALGGWFSLAAWLRTRRARRRLAAIDPRSQP